MRVAVVVPVASVTVTTAPASVCSTLAVGLTPSCPSAPGAPSSPSTPGAPGAPGAPSKSPRAAAARSSSLATFAALAAAAAAAVALDAPCASSSASAATLAACCAFATASEMRASAPSNFSIASRNSEYPSPPPSPVPVSTCVTRTTKGSVDIASPSLVTITCASTAPSTHAIAAGQYTRNAPAEASTASKGSHPRTRRSRCRHSRYTVASLRSTASPPRVTVSASPRPSASAGEAVKHPPSGASHSSHVTARRPSPASANVLVSAMSELLAAKILIRCHRV